MGLGESTERGRLVICWRRPVGTIVDLLRIGSVFVVDAAPKTRSLRVDWSVRYISIISALAGDKGVNSYSGHGVAVLVAVAIC